jgi:hypothetical protein
MKCALCASSTFRTSRLRISDVVRLLLLQYPVRCKKCRERSFASLMFALNLRQASKARHAEDSQRSREDRVESVR